MAIREDYCVAPYPFYFNSLCIHHFDKTLFFFGGEELLCKRAPILFELKTAFMLLVKRNGLCWHVDEIAKPE